MCHHLNYITILGHEYEIQHNPIPHMGTATIHLPQVIQGDETVKRPLLTHVHI